MEGRGKAGSRCRDAGRGIEKKEGGEGREGKERKGREGRREVYEGWKQRRNEAVKQWG